MSRTQRLHEAVMAGVLLGLTAGCAPPPPLPSLDDVAEGYVRVTLQLAQHNPDLVDDWRGPDSWKPGARQPVTVLAGRIAELQKDLDRWTSDAKGEDANRLTNLRLQLNALATQADRLNGVSMTFNEELRRSFPDLRPAELEPTSMPDARAALDALLPGPGPLARRYADYRRRLAVPAPRMEPVMRAALAACRDASRAMQLPPDEEVELAFGHGSRWDGFARYLGEHRTRIEINLDSPLDVTRALRLACHEGYPGHHAQYLLIDDALVKRRGWQEFALSPSFGVHLLVTEGAAEVGADLAVPPPQRIELYRTMLLPAAGLPSEEATRLVKVEELIALLEPVIAEVSRAYLDNTLTQSQATDRLRDEALTPDPEALLAFAERKRSRIVAYPGGRAAVRQAIGDSGLVGLRHLFTDQPFALH